MICVKYYTKLGLPNSYFKIWIISVFARKKGIQINVIQHFIIA